MKSQRLPETEFAIMEIIWDTPDPVTIGQVREKLIAQTRKDYKTQSLVTLFGRLAERGFLRADGEKRGREHLFRAMITREAYLQMETESFFERYHKRNVPSLIAALVGEKLSASDLDELSDFVRKAREEAEREGGAL